LHLRNEKVFLVKCGGMLDCSSYFGGQIDQRLRAIAPQAQFGALAMTPGEAAARIALRLLSTPGGEGKHDGGA
jgi:hypothetical protein